MTNPIYYNRVVTSTVQGDGYGVIEPNGTLVVANGGELRLHDGSTAGGVSVGGGGSNLVSSFGTDQGVGSTYLTGNPVLFTNDDMLIRTGGTAAAGSGGSGQMYILSAESLQIGTATDPATLTDATSGVTCDTSIVLVPAHSGGPFIQTTVGSNQVSLDANGVAISTVRGTVQFGYNLEAPGTPQHFHINKVDQSFDLFFGDDANFLQLPVGGGGPVIGANDGSSGQKLYAFGQNGVLIIPGQIESAADTGPVILNSYDGATTRNWTFGTDGSLSIPQSNSGAGLITAGSNGIQLASNSHTWEFTTNGNIQFPDYTVQTTAFELQGVAPGSIWGTAYPYGNGVAKLDYQFYFDGTTGYPTIQSYIAEGGYPLYNTIWSYDAWFAASSSANPIAGSSGATPIQVNNTGGATLMASVLQPGDYVTVRIINVDTGRIFRVTFMGSVDPNDFNIHTYGAITVERLL